MHQHAGAREEMRERESGAKRGVICDETVVIEAHACAQVPVAPVHLVLHIRGLLAIACPIGKVEGFLQAGIELRRISDCILQRLMHVAEHAVSAEFPVMPAGMSGEIYASIALTITALLVSNDRG